MATSRTRTVGLAAFLLVAIGAQASAQVLGTFSWQFAPFCNVVTVLVEQKGNVFELTGTDNLCGGPVLAAASGTAHLNPNGTASVALTIQRPDGIPVSVSASLNLATLSGTWADNFTNTGTFTFNPPAPAGRRGPSSSWVISLSTSTPAAPATKEPTASASAGRYPQHRRRPRRT